MKKLDSYVLTEIFRPFVGTMGFFYFLFLMFQTLRLSDFVIGHRAPLDAVIKMAFFVILSFSSFIFPVAFLAAVLIGVGRLSTDQELIAMKSCGISIYRIAAPVFVLAIVASILSIALTMEWGPWGERSLTEEMLRAGGTKVAQNLKEKVFNQDFFDLLIYADHVDKQTGAMTNVFIYDERQPNEPRTIVAKQGALLPIQSKQEFGGQVLLSLNDGKTYRIDPSTDTSDVMSFSTYSLYLKIPEASVNDLQHPRMMGLSSLLQGMRSHSSRTQAYRDVATEFWKRLAVGLSPLVMGFLALGLATARVRSSSSGAMILTVVVMAVYWQLLLYSNEIANSGRIAPWIGLEIPNVIIAIAAVIAMKRAAW